MDVSAKNNRDMEGETRLPYKTTRHEVLSGRQNGGGAEGSPLCTFSVSPGLDDDSTDEIFHFPVIKLRSRTLSR